MAISIDNLKEQIPYYLTQEARDGLVKAFKDFPENLNYYTIEHSSELLQGDGWNELDIINIENAERKSIKGIILSNSCDISSDNVREIAHRIVFAPIIPLPNYESLLIKSGIKQSKIESRINSIKSQQVTSLFYLPKGAGLDSDHIAILDELHSIPALTFSRKKKVKQFTLSQLGFYLFLFKLSIHFCRFHENLLRDSN